MTEAEWLAATEPSPMLKFLEGKASNRKLRLFVVALARIFWEQVPEGEMRDAVNQSELYADNPASTEQIDDYRHRFYRYLIRGITPEPSEQYKWHHNTPGIRHVFSFVSMTVRDDSMLQYILTTPQPLRDRRQENSITPYFHLLPPHIRDIFGNPFRPLTINPSWLTSTVLALASGIYSEKAFDRMPQLADALQDAGCDNEDILNHCRQPGQHCRGCWVVDLILDKK
jgi:hypothetical protein